MTLHRRFAGVFLDHRDTIPNVKTNNPSKYLKQRMKLTVVSYDASQQN